jgi:exodeoxyribonuclease V beta subunit
LKEKFIKAINAYKGSDSNSKEVIPLDKIEEISVLGYTLSTEDKRKIAEAEKFDNIKKIPAYSKAFEIPKSCPENRFSRTSTIEKFTDTLEKWKKGKALFSAKSFADNEYIQTNWQPDVYASFIAFNTLKNSLKNFNDILLNNFLIAQTPIVFDEWQNTRPI